MRYKVIKRLPAIYTEVYLVDAASDDEAKRAVQSGRARCKSRAFATTPGASPAAGYCLLSGPAATMPMPGWDFEHLPAAEVVGQSSIPALSNGRFMTPAGLETQQVVQELEE